MQGHTAVHYDLDKVQLKGISEGKGNYLILTFSFLCVPSSQ